MGSGPSFGWIATAVWYRQGKQLYGRQGYEQASLRFRPEHLGRMDGRSVIVTGANQGIGYEAALWFAELGATVHLVCRNTQRAFEAKSAIIRSVPAATVEYHVLDVSNLGEVEQFATSFAERYASLDVLVNNAGCMPTERTTTAEGHEAIMACTLGGSYLLTQRLMPMLSKASSGLGRVINVSSGGMYTVSLPTYDDLDHKEVKYDGRLYYAVAKRIQVTLTELFAQKYPMETSKVMFTSMHPGWAETEAVKTSMPDFHESNKGTLRSPRQGADTIVFLGAAPPEVLKNGKFYFDREVVPTHLSGAGTASTPETDEAIWNKVVAYCRTA